MPSALLPPVVLAEMLRNHPADMGVLDLTGDAAELQHQPEGRSHSRPGKDSQTWDEDDDIKLKEPPHKDGVTQKGNGCPETDNLKVGRLKVRDSEREEDEEGKPQSRP
jgi:hypothetical protein